MPRDDYMDRFDGLTLDAVKSRQQVGLKRVQTSFKNSVLPNWINDAAHEGKESISFVHDELPKGIDREFLFPLLDELIERGFEVKFPYNMEEEAFYGYYKISWSEDG